MPDTDGEAMTVLTDPGRNQIAVPLVLYALSWRLSIRFYRTREL